MAGRDGRTVQAGRDFLTVRYYDLVVENTSKYTDGFYTYRSDEPLQVGDVVRVPWNRGNQEKRAYVFGENASPGLPPEKIKAVLGPDPDIFLTPEIIQTCRWMVQRYSIKYIDAIHCFVPPGKAPKEGKEKRPLQERTPENQPIDALTEEQETVLAPILDSLETGAQANYLLHGVTGSGKTEVYMRAIAGARAAGKTAIMLVPEIALTSQVIDRFLSRFPREELAILHSRLTTRERFDEWTRIRTGQATIVIGARMAVFAPCENIGLIIMDEEHEATYKSDQTPKYETVDIALKRLLHYRGVLLLGSATPSVVSYQRAQSGIYRLLTMEKRYNETPLPIIRMVDMREELQNGNTSLFSQELYQAMTETLDRGEQVILFLNRRGYSTFLSCRQCGEPVVCPDCGISLTYHQREQALVCHYCGKSYPVQETCAACGGKTIRYLGAGTEKVQEQAQELFPEAVIDRLDLDTAKNGRAISRILGDFAKGKTQILIGTQLVAKGLDFRKVGLAAVMAADGSLSIPDFRSTERTFQLVTQVAGRAGRGDRQGTVIIQTYQPDHFALQRAAAYDYLGFYREEIRLRELMEYPPFTDLILVEIASSKGRLAEDYAQRCRQWIVEKLPEADPDQIFLPREAAVRKGKDQIRWQLLIKSEKTMRNPYLHHIRMFRDWMIRQKADATLIVDVNPYSTL